MIICGIKNYLQHNTAELTTLLDALDDDDLMRYSRYKNESVARQFLWGRLLLRYMLCQYYHYPNQKISFVYNEYGKPGLADERVFFNISHSNQWIVCVVDDCNVGIDIQSVDKWRPAVARRITTKDEYASLMNRDEVAKIDLFYAMWALKESYSKAIGTGLTMPFNSFAIKKSRSGRLFKTDDYYFLKQYEIDHHYKLAVCSASGDFARQISIINPRQLCAYWIDAISKDK